MITGTSVKRRGEWQEAADTITLDESARHRRRMAMVSDGGIAFLLDLPEAVFLSDGDAIALDDGRLVAVKAKPEPLYAVFAETPERLLVLAWHIGGWRLPARMLPDRILIRRDAAVRQMLEELGAGIEEIDAAFDPEGGSHEGGGYGYGFSADVYDHE